jgi:hypothetical protein
MKKAELFQTTAVLHPDGTLEVMGGSMRHVRAEAAKTLAARAIVVREVPPAGDLGELLSELEPIVDRAVRRTAGWLRDNGHKIDDEDRALLKNALRALALDLEKRRRP